MMEMSFSEMRKGGYSSILLTEHSWNPESMCDLQLWYCEMVLINSDPIQIICATFAIGKM